MIKPKSAASIWVVDEELFLELPGTGSRTHQIKFKNDAKGLSLALEMLHKREDSTLLAEPGDLTQYQVDKAYMKKLAAASTIKPKGTKAKAKFSDEQRESAKEVLRRMGMI